MPCSATLNLALSAIKAGWRCIVLFVEIVLTVSMAGRPKFKDSTKSQDCSRQVAGVGVILTQRYPTPSSVVNFLHS